MTLQRNENPQALRPGEYAPIHWRVASTPHVHILAVVCCPTCGHGMSIASNRHTVGADGALSPSLVCPYEGCPFHVFARLDGWVAGEADPVKDAT